MGAAGSSSAAGPFLQDVLSPSLSPPACAEGCSQTFRDLRLSDASSLSSPSHPSPISACCRGWHPRKWKVGRVLTDGQLQPLASSQKLLEGEAKKKPSRNFRRCSSDVFPSQIHFCSSKSGAISSYISSCLGRAAPGCSETAQLKISCPARKKWNSPDLKLHHTNGQSGICTHILCPAMTGQITATRGRRRALKVSTHILSTG